MGHFARVIGSRIQICITVVVLTAGVQIIGCGVAAPPAQETEGRALVGIVHGGQQPVTGAAIQLYAAGSTGDASAAAPLLKSAVVTDGSGNFSISNDYTCPVANPEVYLVATGGNPGLIAGTNNSDIAMMAALGPCASLSQATYISIDEVTTVGSIAALYPYMTSYANLGSGTADAAAFTAAFSSVSEFTNIANGSAPGPNLPAGYYASSTEINTLSDVLAACLNSAGGKSNDGSACGNLFYQATPTSGIAPTDTIGATLNIVQDKDRSAAGIFSLVPSQGPFQPTLAAAPASWHLAVVAVPATPVISIASGTYNYPELVGIADSTSGATIYYTLDGSAPTASSTPYTGVITVALNETLNAIAIKTGYGSSAVASAVYTFAVAVPTTYISLTTPQTLNLYDETPGAKIYYTTDGSTPTASSTLYSTTLTIAATETVKVIGILSGYANSPVESIPFTLPNISPLSISAGCNASDCPVLISLEGPIAGAKIYYTTDGSIPTVNSAIFLGTTYVQPYPGHPVTVSAFATAPYYNQSAVSSVTSTYPALGNFAVYPQTGTYTGPLTVQMYATDYADLGYNIHYTTDGSTPTCTSALYNGASLTVSKSEIVSAVGCSGSYVNSSIIVRTYTID